MLNRDKHIAASKALDDILIDINRINMDWNFLEKNDFDLLAENFIKELELTGKKVFYLKAADTDVEHLKKMRDGESIPFGSGTTLIKIGDDPIHHYIYRNDHPVVFGVHFHLEYKETIKPLKSDIAIYVYKPSGIQKVTLKKGQTYTVPEGIKHAAIFFNGENDTEIMWH